MTTNLVVQKYGGTSVGSLDKIKLVAQHIQRTVAAGKKLLVVVSAMGTYTDELLDLAHQLSSSPPKRELDMLLTTGERISTSLLCIALHQLGVDSISFTGSQSGILTDENHGNARIQEVRSDRLLAALERYPVVIVAGFQGVCPVTKDITSLGRGGSDLTGVALAVALKAESCQIYTDVPGVLTCDPRLVPEAQLIPEISWEDMLHLAWAGAQVMHHRAAYLAQKNKLPVEIRFTRNPQQCGTLIGGTATMERPCVTAITYKKNQSLVTFTIGLRPGSRFSPLVAALESLWLNNESPLSIQQFWENDEVYSIKVICDSATSEQLKEALSEQCRRYECSLLASSELSNLATISVVGHGFRQSRELVATVHNCIDCKPYYCDQQDHCLTIVIEACYLEAHVKRLHTALFPQ